MSLLTGAIGAAVGALVARVIVGERPETPAQPNIPAIAVGTPVNRPAQNTQQPATTERAIAEPTPQKEWGKDIQQQEPAELVSAR